MQFAKVNNINCIPWHLRHGRTSSFNFCFCFFFPISIYLFSLLLLLRTSKKFAREKYQLSPRSRTKNLITVSVGNVHISTPSHDIQLAIAMYVLAMPSSVWCTTHQIVSCFNDKIQKNQKSHFHLINVCI